MVPDCCYDDVQVSHVHLELQNTKLGDAKAAAALAFRAGNAVLLNASLALSVNGFVRLCVHDDPFSKHACSTLYNCKGNYAVAVQVESATELAFAVNSSSGRPEFTVARETAAVPVLTPSNLCGKIADQIVAQKATVVAQIEKLVPALVNARLAAIVASLPAAIEVSPVWGALWRLEPTASTVDGQLLLAGDLAVFLRAYPSVVGPYAPRAPLPALPADAAAVQLAFADSVVANVLWAYFDAGVLHSPWENFTVLGSQFAARATCSRVPLVEFDADEQIMQFALVLDVLDDTGAEFLSANVTVAANTSVAVTPASTILLQLKAAAVDDLSIDPVVFHVPGNISLDWALSVMNQLLLGYVPKINALLEDDQIPIPNVPGVVLTNPSVTFAPGACLLKVDAAVSGHAAPLERELAAVLRGATAFKCPPSIGGGHLDSCI